MALRRPRDEQRRDCRGTEDHERVLGGGLTCRLGNARPHVLGHDGSDNGTSSYMFFDPADGAGVILLSNGMWSDANDDSPGADALMATLFAESTDY